MTIDILQTGIRAIQCEAKALGDLETSLINNNGDIFKQAVLRLAQLQVSQNSKSHAQGKSYLGRVIVTGMGKSGHIAQKIAATMASTGTPAQFVHPAEASHGDLGMITHHDVILALSNSGETTELASVMTHAANENIDIIAITAGANSTLAKAAKYPLILPPHEEASDIGLAPTTSTTLALVLGDALAVALLEYNGFGPDQFHRLHPGGKLGQKLMKVGDFMHQAPDIPLVGASVKMRQAIVDMTKHHFGCLGIIDEVGKLAGIITDGDLRRHADKDEFLTLTTADIMTASPKVLKKNIMARMALEQMNENKITVFFVVDDDGKPIGIVHIHDFLRGRLIT